MFVLFFACSSNYALNNVSEDSPQGSFSVTELDPLEEVEAAEELEEETEANPSEEDVEISDYCTPFEDFSEWSFFGDGNWHIENNVLYENKGGYYATTAYLYDFGQTSSFSMEVDARWEGNLNDLSGFVFNLDPDSGTHWTATIDDPQGDYERYSPNGAIIISHCIWDECTPVAQDSSLEMLAMAQHDIVNMKLEISDSSVSFYWNHTLALSQEIPNIGGPGIVGLYSNDNDGGVMYDDFCIYID